MRIKQRWLLSFGLICCLLLASVAQMQDEIPVVPDLIGMNIPQATAALNKIGMSLGTQLSEPWTEISGIAPDTISAQSIPVGEGTVPGGTVDVLLVRSPNARLVYDENDLTLINNTGADVDFNGLAFGVAEGTTPAAFAATRWTSRLSAGGCAQIWSVIRSVPKDVDGCARINTWLTTNNSAEHFWTGLNGVTSFRVVQGGAERGTCPAAPAGSAPLACDIFLPAAGIFAEMTPYIYLAYTPDRLIIFNRSDAQFMPLSGTKVVNRNPNLTPPNQEITIGDPGLYALLNPVATVTQLAPGQCIFFTTGAEIPVSDTPEPCSPIARIDISPSLIFWAANFDLISATDGQNYTCNAAVAEQLTVCVMPR